jgi:hypothetical protein
MAVIQVVQPRVPARTRNILPPSFMKLVWTIGDS